MGKIAIITTHRANNFGAMLQCYSLVNAFRENGIDAYILDWRFWFFEREYHWIIPLYSRFNVTWKAMKQFWLCDRGIRKRYAAFRSLLPMSRKLFFRWQLNRIDREFDGFVVGSDQVWNPANCSHTAKAFDRTNLLDFVHTKRRYSYAASIGVREIRPPELLKEFIAAWKNFDIITTREHEGAEYITRMAGVPAVPVLDPVLLHDSSWWRKVATPVTDRGYILFYNVRESCELAEYVEREASRRHLKIITCRCPLRGIPKVGDPRVMGPQDFVGYVANADLIVTNSFHASAFSVIFSKELHIEVNSSSASPNSRISSLFQYAGLVPKSVAQLNSRKKVHVIDCSETDADRFEHERNRSLAWLQKMNGSAVVPMEQNAS